MDVNESHETRPDIHSLLTENLSIDFQQIFNLLPIALYVVDLNFIILEANVAMLKMANRDRDQIVGKYVFEAFPPDPNDPEDKGGMLLKASLEKVLATKKSDVMGEVKYNITDPAASNGSYHEFYWRPSNYPIFDSNGELVYILHYAENITNYMLMRNRAQHTELANLKLEELQHFLELVLENIPNAVFVKDAKELKFIKLNKAYEDLIGYSEKDFLGKSEKDFIEVNNRNHSSEEREIFSLGKIIDKAEETIRTRHKGERIVHTKKVPLYDEKGNPLYLIGIAEDITEKVDLIKARIAKESAEEMARKKLEFLDLAAHELRSPITTLVLLLQQAERRLKKSPATEYQFLEKIRSPAMRLRRLVNDLLEMSRLEKGMLVLVPTPVDVGSFLSKYIEEFQLIACKRSIHLHLPKETVEAEIDTIRFAQVITNLLDNATKYTTGPIDVILEDMTDKVRISVKDYGHGIPKNQQETLFNQFIRGTSELTYKASGLGLGLSVCKGIVEMHGGTISLISGENMGSNFVILLPKKMALHKAGPENLKN